MNILFQILLFSPLLLVYQQLGICAPQSAVNATQHKNPFANLPTGGFQKAMEQKQQPNEELVESMDYDDVDDEKGSPFANQTTGGYRTAMKNVTQPKMYFYDKFGVLNIDGTVSGVSKPIVLDYKKYWPKCSTNVHFFFTIKVPDEKTVDIVKSMARKSNLTAEDQAEMLSSCPYGITFCYEGQLDGPSIRDEYRVTNFVSDKMDDTSRPSQKVGFQCMLATDSPMTHGFNLAVVAFADLKSLKIGDEKPWNNKYKVWRFLMFTMSIVKEEYYFEIPKDGKVMLQIGDRQNFRSYLVDSNGKKLKQVSFEYRNKTYGAEQMQEEFTIPDPQDFFSDHRGFWMLYLDFKKSYRELQVVKTIHSEDCQMMVEIHGNRMKKCRTYFEDIAVTEPSDVELDLLYTYENGNIRRNDHGQEDLHELLRRMEKEDLRKKTTKEVNDTKTDQRNATHETEGSSHEKETKKEKKSYYGGGVSGNIGYTKTDKSEGEGQGQEGEEAADGSGEKQGAENGKKFVEKNGDKDLTKEAENKAKGPLPAEKKEQLSKGQKALNVMKDLGKKGFNKSLELGGGLAQQGIDSGSTYLKTKIDTAINPKEEETTTTPASEGEKPNQGNMLNDQMKQAEDLLQQKTSQVSMGMASLMARSQSRATAMFGEFGNDLIDVVNKGEEKIKEFTAKMQNLIPPSVGGSLSSAVDRRRALMPKDLSTSDFLNPEPPKLPKEGVKLPGGQLLTNDLFENWPQGVRMPSSWADYEDGNSVVSKSNWWNEKIRSTGGDIATRNDFKMKHGDDTPTNFVRRHKRAVEAEAWIDRINTEDDVIFSNNNNKRARRQKREFNADLNAEINAQKTQGSSQSNKEGKSNFKSDKKSNRVFNHVSTARSMMESFKHTSGITNSLTSADFVQYSQTFSHREAVDIHVANLPKNTKIVISQLIFECDGNVMKLPKLFFHDTKEILEGYTQNALGVQSIGDVNPNPVSDQKPKNGTNND